ncbi:MAG: hypothetical protein ACK4PR_14000, partial [Gammaproteobacteria bacterium]
PEFLSEIIEPLVTCHRELDTMPECIEFLNKNEQQPETIKFFLVNFWHVLSSNKIEKIISTQHHMSNAELEEIKLFNCYLSTDLQHISASLGCQTHIKLQSQHFDQTKLAMIIYFLRKYENIDKLELIECTFAEPIGEPNDEIKNLISNDTIDRPFTLTIKNCDLNTEVLKILRPYIALLKGLKELDLSYNKLDDVSLQNFASWGIAAYPALEQFNMNHNQLTYIGAADFLRICKTRDYQISKFHIKHNWLYIQSSVTQSTRALINLLCNTKIAFFDISGNYLEKSPENEIANNTKLIKCKSAFEIHPQPSLLGAVKVMISYDKWAIYLLRHKNTEHTKLIVEGWYEFGQRFLQMWHFVQDNVDPTKGVVESQFYDPDRVFSEVNDDNFKCYLIFV